MKISKILVLLLLIFTACQSHPPPRGVRATLHRIVSGQTIEAIVNNALVKVRLTGINAPDWQQTPWGEESKQKLAELLTQHGQQPLTSTTILLETNLHQQDRYGRIQAYIWQNGVLVNEELIAQGYALADLAYTNDRYSQRLSYAQDYARLMGYGIWNPTQPLRQTPQQFRQQQENSN
jgi:micrococcal nuclease